MNVAITSQDKKRVTGHAERCQHFWVFEIVDGEVHNKHCLSIPETSTFSRCDFVHEGHPLDGVSILITHGMGHKLQISLKEIGITGLITDERDPDAAIHHFLDGTLPVKDTDDRKHPHFHELIKHKGFNAPHAGMRHLGPIS